MVLFRFTVIVLALATLILGITGLSGEIRAARATFVAKPIAPGLAQIVYIPRSSAEENARFKAGDVIDTRPAHFANYAYLRAGQERSITVLRNGRPSVIRYRIGSATAFNPLDRGAAGFAIITMSLLTGVYIGVKAANRRAARILSLFLIAGAAGVVAGWHTLTAATNSAAFIWSAVANYLAFAYLNYGLIVLGTEFPAVPSRLRAALRATALPCSLLYMLFTLWNDSRTFTPLVPFVSTVNGVPLPYFLLSFDANILVTGICVAGCLVGLMKADAEHRAQMQWMGTVLIVTSMAWMIPTAWWMIAPAADLPGAAWIALLQDTPLLVLPYVILRHRLVDLTVVISRAAIFTTVSVVVISAFILGEWLIGKTAEKALPGGESGLAGQMIVLGIALAIGLSARTIHSLVDRKLNALFFARRARSLLNLRHFAEETDVIVKGSALLKLFYQTLANNVEATYTAVYLRDGSTFVLNQSSRTDLPQGIDEDDPIVVRVRRWREAFELPREDHAFSEALIVPMNVRGSIVGLVVCGPKAERTHYSSEEIEAIAQAANRATISYVLLSHPTISAPALLGVS